MVEQERLRFDQNWTHGRPYHPSVGVQPLFYDDLLVGVVVHLPLQTREEADVGRGERARFLLRLGSRFV